MIAEKVGTCTLCPRLCRPSCPVASGSAREAATPTAIASVLLDWERGLLPAAMAAEAATLCTDCGACEAHCHLHRPLPEALREARRALVSAPIPEPVRPVEGSGRYVAVESDDRRWAEALAKRLGAPVARWVTHDGLGVELVEHPGFAAQARALVAASADRQLVVADGGAATALRAAGVPFSWLHDLVPGLVVDGLGSCACGGDRPMACCGAGGPLKRHHPEDARRVAQAWQGRTEARLVKDARCRGHLAASDPRWRDAVDRLLEAS
jgi:hypothetical protein